MITTKLRIPDILIIIAVLVILALFVVPANPVVIDCFILFNVIFTVVLISLVIYVDSPVKLSFFPSLLLIITLFRIGLSISTSRLILLTAHAGSFITIAGQYLVGDNIVVGIIIFVIIAIVNFLVVTKGSERVAEVVARFTLDGLPGRQMSIDADLKAGNINLDEAKYQRKMLQLESSLYGALDGATKFIKGDVISNMIIVAINLIGGIIIAVYQKDFDISEAVATYSILSIGDGILQQIPITLSSIAGGIIVTRINTTSTTGSIGESIKTIIKESSMVLIIAAAILPMLFFIPGLPKIPIGFAFIFLITSYLLVRYSKIGVQESDVSGVSKISDYSANNTANPKATSDAAGGGGDAYNNSNLPAIDPWKVYPIIVVLAQNIVASKRNKSIKGVLESVGMQIYSRLGVELPQIFITSGNLNDNSYQILVNEVVVSEAKLYDDLVLVPSSEVATIVPSEYLLENTVDIGQIERGYWVNSSQISLLDSFNLKYFTQEQFLLEHVTDCLINSLQDLIGFQEVKIMLDRMVEYQELIKELLKMIPLNKITDVIRRLLIERIPIRNFKVILDALLEWSPKESETILLVEYVRIALAKYIGQMFKVNGKIYAISIDADLEDKITESMRYTSNGFYLDLNENFYTDFNNRLTEIIDGLKLKNKIVVVTKLNIRKAVSHIIGKKYNIAVLSNEEVQASGVELEVFDFIY